MKKSLTQIVCILIFKATALSQAYLPLQDNWQIPSDTSIKIIAGNYVFSDTAADGVIQIVNKTNITIDGDSVTVDGANTLGYMIYIINSNNITIKNFQGVKNYYYAVYIKSSQNITITNCNFSENKKDTVGWIVIFDGPNNALGGGIFMDICSNSVLDSNTMQYQNDGVAVYNSSNITMRNNNLSWNTAYGIRMYRTDSCYIFNNNCSNINRITDPSDCAAILVLECSENRIEYNDFTYSGDGVFLNDKNTFTPANNYFAWNDCSYSPHNAVEAVFSSGNVFKHNICNFSNYGFWLGYSFNTIVDSNEITNNAGIDADGGGGIAVDRGYNMTFSNNNISNNSNGIKVWEKGPPEPPYTNTSHDFLIENNTFYANVQALYSENTDRLIVKNNQIKNNGNGITINGSTIEDTITGCAFNNNIMFYIENNSPSDIYAVNNLFPDDTSLIACKIFDIYDTASSGEVIWNPYVTGVVPVYELNPPSDLMEKPSVWDAYYYVEDAAPTTVTWDSVDKKTGNEALFIDTESGYKVILHYFPADSQVASWNIIDTGSITFWMKINITDPNNFWGVQQTFIRLGNRCGGYYQYEGSANVLAPSVGLFPSEGQWVNFTIPLAGNANWAKTIVGAASFSDVSYIEINVDVWEYGYEMRIDGLSLPFIFTSSVKEPYKAETIPLQIFPNPFSKTATIAFRLNKPGLISLNIVDGLGQIITSLVYEEKLPGLHTVAFDGNGLSDGVYYCILKSGDSIAKRKMILMK